MKKFMKDTDKKFLISLFIIVMLLSTFMAYTIYAQEVTDEMVSKGEGLANGTTGATGYLTISDLIYDYSIFCCSKGTPLIGSSRATLVTPQGNSDPAVTGTLKPGDEGMKLFEVVLEGETTTTPFEDEYVNKTYGEYEVVNVKIASPKEAYILAEMINNLPNGGQGGFVFRTGADGSKVEFTDTNLISTASNIITGDQTVYVIEDEGTGTESLVMKDSDGKYYYVEEAGNSGLGIYSYVQRAWWNTEAGGTGNNVTPNELTKEAELFEAYISRIAKSTNTEDFVQQDFEMNGIKGTVYAPEIEYTASYNTGKVTESGVTYDLDNPTVAWDSTEQVYKIGPFSLNYVEESAAIEGRNPVLFAGITDAALYTDASTEPLVRGQDWNFIWQKGQRDEEDSYEFPHENEIFYIKLNYIEGVTKLTDLLFNFKYMNAGGQYEDLKGTYYEATWTPQEKATWCRTGKTCSHGRMYAHTWTTGSGDTAQTHYCYGGTPCAHGKYRAHIESTTYWLELESMGSPITSQLLAGGLIGARWYKETDVHYQKDPISTQKEGRIKIEKQLVDDQGNVIPNLAEEEYFTFKVTVNGESEEVKVKAGEFAYSKLYTWKEGEEAPSYTVEELPKEGYVLKEITNATGKLENGTVTVVAKNITKKEGNIVITKEVKDDSLKDRAYNFEVSLTGTFQYEGIEYKDTTLKIPASVTPETDWKSSQVTWYGDAAPTYVVDEIPGEDYELESLLPRTGKLISDATINTVKVVAINDVVKEKAKLHIIKTLENADLHTAEHIESLVFRFDIEVQGYGKNRVELNAKKVENTYIWEYTSDDYYWKEGENPTYTITEVELPEGTEFKSAESPDTTITVTDTTVAGTLVSDETKDYIVTNNIINCVTAPKEGKLQINKTVNSDTLVNKEYKFKVKITGSFEYKGVTYKDAVLYLTNDNAILEENITDAPFVNITVGESKTETWESDTFKWYEEAPTYEVEENMSGLDGVQSTINPKEGRLKEGPQPTIVIAENRTKESKKGALHIIKTLENAINYSDEYIKSLNFKFKITVDGKDYGVVTLEPQKVNDDYIWEHKSEYTWDADKEAPTYTIEEVELPEGTEFVSANSSNGTTSGKVITGTLKSDAEEDYIIKNEYINKLTTTESGFLKIEKKVLDDVLNGKSFKFNVKINGSFEYNGTVYNKAIMELNDIEVTGGNTWTSSEIKWFGTNAPTYEVVEQESTYAEQKSVINSVGTLVAGDTAKAQVATFTNASKKTSGNIQITKKLEDGVTSDETFYFDIEVEGYDKFTVGVKAGETYRTQEFIWDVAAEAPKYTVTEHDSDKANFVNISNGTETSTNRTISGSLASNQIINVVCINKLDEHKGKLKITKEVIIDEKVKEEALDAEFTIKAVISGSFELNGESVVDSTRTITQTLKAGESFVTPEIKWYGKTAPTYEVTEIDLPEGWIFKNVSNGNGQLIEEGTAEVVVTNSLSSRVIVDLTMEMAGIVWEDLRVENKESELIETYGTQGIYDEKLEQGIDNIEVYIDRVVYKNGVEISRSAATAYEEGTNTKINFPIYTDNGGHWYSPRMSVPALTVEEKEAGCTAAYDVSFIYDGQTYEPTDFLKTSNGDANAYKKASTAKRDNWAKDSMALDFNREEVDGRIAEIKGDREISGDGTTIGKAVQSNGTETPLYYKASDYTEGLSSSRKISELQTKDANGNVFDIFKAIARTSQGGLTYPFDNKSHLESVDKYIDELGVVERYKYSATYHYTLNVNLGLIKREDADLGTTKDLYSAKVIANEKVLNYKFNTLADLTGNTISRQLKADEMNITYELGLYKTDYYYRAELYQTNGRVYDAVNTFYKSLGKDIDSTELDVYLTYKIKVYNESPNYIVNINSVNDYFDSSFTLVNDAETKYIQTSDGVTIESVTEVANKSYIETSSGKKTDVNWNITESNIKGSDGRTYNKMTANFNKEDLRLVSGEKAEIAVTFKVQKQDTNGIKDAVILGQKANVAEIASYSTYYEDGKAAGKVDKDSAPGNVNIREYNDRTWYEDDTDSAPILNLTISGEERQINGIAWEDKEDTEVPDGKGQKVGNGVYDADEALIGGLTTQLVEKVMVKNEGSDSQYTEYDFIWPTNMSLNELGGRTLQSLTGFDSTIETSRTQAPEGDTEGLKLGEYRFEGVPAGNYVVRFLYGNDKTELKDSEGITGEPVALKLDGSGNVVQYSNNANILTANYDQDLEGHTPAIYNGQDFKTTTYQNGVANTNAEGYLNNEWHDLSLGDIRISDARDSEARRVEMMSNSYYITNVNGVILSTANDKTANHTELFRDYYMFADTAKINVNIEQLDTDAIVDQETLKNANIPSGIEVKFAQGKVLKDGIAQTNEFIYIIKNIDIGLEERSETAMVLDKQISSIKLTTSDGRDIFNAIYDINYEEISAAEFTLGKFTKIAEVNGNYLVAKVSLNSSSIATDVLQAINKEEDKDKETGTQNFRFINVDETILQGSTIEIKYKLTVLNVSETDRIDTKLQEIDQTALANNTTVAKELIKLSDTIKKENATYTKAPGKLTFNETTKVGNYLGTTYYQGANANGKDTIVTTTVRQLVDYVDNDAVFSAVYNNGVDNSWRNANINEVTGNGYKAERLLDRDIIRENNIQDKNGVVYITDQKNQIILSVDNTENSETLTNKGFEIELLPYEVDNSKYSSSITLTTTRTIAAESDADSLAFDNLAEIVKMENTAGRRDVTTIPGNASPRKGEFAVTIAERDSSATELVTLTPPTGIETTAELTVQILAVSMIGLIIIAVGVIVIKKKVLAK